MICAHFELLEVVDLDGALMSTRGVFANADFCLDVRSSAEHGLADCAAQKVRGFTYWAMNQRVQRSHAHRELPKLLYFTTTSPCSSNDHLRELLSL